MRHLHALFALTLIIAGPHHARGADDGPTGPTPPRLGFVDGEVSFWRPGAEDWGPAQVNTALAAGDEVYAADGGNVELQIGPRAFVRAGSDTQLGLESLDADRMQYKVTGGHAALDLKHLPRGATIEVATPSAAFEIDRPGYYRVDVDDDRTVFSARRGGVATVSPLRGDGVEIDDGQQVVLAGDGRVDVSSVTDLDDWDRWNYERTAGFGERARSAEYVPADVAGVDDLDRYGDWREEPRYGRVWRPREVAPDWSPYSTGRWVYDPYYEWTWVDDAPWGWAPYHYGRWVHVGGYWGWTPGPVVVRPVYAPALVAFFGAPGVSVSIGAPVVSWVALGFGEPIVPWWRGHRYVGRPYWGGWGGPRIVNNVVVRNTTIVNVRNINRFQNFGVRNAVVGVDRARFGRGRFEHVRVEPQRLRPIHGELGVRPATASLVPRHERGRRPPERFQQRKVVATRAPVDPIRRLRSKGIEAPLAAPRTQAEVVRSRRGSARRQVTPAAAPPEAPGHRQQPQPGAVESRRPTLERDQNARRGSRGRPAEPRQADRAPSPPPPDRGAAPDRPRTAAPTPPARGRDERRTMGREPSGRGTERPGRRDEAARREPAPPREQLGSRERPPRVSPERLAPPPERRGARKPEAAPRQMTPPAPRTEVPRRRPDNAARSRQEPRREAAPQPRRETRREVRPESRAVPPTARNDGMPRARAERAPVKRERKRSDGGQPDHR